MSELSPLSGVKRKSYFRAAKTVFDPTRTSAGGALHAIASAAPTRVQFEKLIMSVRVSLILGDKTGAWVRL